MKAKLKSLFKFKRQTFAYPYVLFMMIFIVVPLVLVLVNAFIDDYTGKITFDNVVAFFSEGNSLKTLGISILIGILTTLACLFMGYPVAYFLVKYKMGKIMVLLFVLPMWVNFLLRTMSMAAIFNKLGWALANNYVAVFIGMVYNYLPFMIMPLYTSIESVDKSFKEASFDLGADRVTTFVKVTLPLTVPGILSGITMVFIPTISTFAISEILSEKTILLFGDSINTKFQNGLYGVGSVMSLVMLLFVIVSNVVMSRFNSNQQGARSIW